MGKIIVAFNEKKPNAAKMAKQILEKAKKMKQPDRDFAVVLGGDGMMIKAARRFAPRGIPFLGINLGRLGFLSGTDYKNIFSFIKNILHGRYRAEERAMLDVEMIKNSGRSAKFIALNDVALKNGSVVRVIDLKLRINGELISEITSDGLLISTPTGSTAYCLAAGGPIVHPLAEVLIVVPVSPHSLAYRPLVLSNKDTVEIEVSDNDNPIVLSVDGQLHRFLRSGDKVKIKISGIKAKLIFQEKNGYYEVLKEKFGWGK